MRTNNLIIILLTALCLSVSTQATTMNELSLQALATSSEMVVQAKVTAVVKQWNADRSCIYTYIRMNIIDDLIGDDEDNEIIIKQLGGQMGGITLYVEGATTYKVGEESMLFLFTDPANLSAFQTLGMYQGKYELYQDQGGITRVRQSNSSGVKLVRGSEEALEKGNDLSLEEFKAQVLEYINSKDRKEK